MVLAMPLAATLAVAAAAAEAPPATTKRRDVLMIAIVRPCPLPILSSLQSLTEWSAGGQDDMRPEQGAYGCEYMVTPHIDRLAEDSVVFDHMYTTQAVCCPSRTSLLTSRRPDTSRIWGNSGTDMWRLQGGNFTSLPQHFRDAGYIVLGTGKIYHPVPAMNYDSKYSWSPEALPCGTLPVYKTAARTPF